MSDKKNLYTTYLVVTIKTWDHARVLDFQYLSIFIQQIQLKPNVLSSKNKNY